MLAILEQLVLHFILPISEAAAREFGEKELFADMDAAVQSRGVRNWVQGLVGLVRSKKGDGSADRGAYVPLQRFEEV